jgi:hypothetical protein
MIDSTHRIAFDAANAAAPWLVQRLAPASEQPEAFTERGIASAASWHLVGAFATLPGALEAVRDVSAETARSSAAGSTARSATALHDRPDSGLTALLARLAEVDAHLARHATAVTTESWARAAARVFFDAKSPPCSPAVITHALGGLAAFYPAPIPA